MAKFIEWTDDLSVGIEEIDEQHKVLVGLVNEMHEAIHQFLFYILPLVFQMNLLVPVRLGWANAIIPHTGCEFALQVRVTTSCFLVLFLFCSMRGL